MMLDLTLNKILRYHLMTHVIDDIERLGSPRNVNGRPCESNFVPQKREAKRTQRRSDNFLKQMSMRMHEKLVFSHAISRNLMKGCQDQKQGEDNVPVGGSRFDVLLRNEAKTPYVQWKKKERKQAIRFQDNTVYSS